MNMDGRIALVTGGGRRLGRAIAVSLAENGADVLLHVHSSSGSEVTHTIESLGRRAILLRADLSTAKGAVHLGKEALQIFGHVDILINNAAVFFPTPISRITTLSWKSIIQTNLTASFFLALVLGRSMRDQGEGKIIQLGDWSGIRPLLGYLPYGVSKSGVFSFTQAFAKAWAPKVQVNAVAPGPVLPPEQYEEERKSLLTEQTPLRRLGHESDVVRTVQFLVQSGDFVTGATYFVDGGWLAKGAAGSEIS